MKAVIVKALGGSETLRYQEWETPEPDAGQVLIRNHITSVNFADIKARSGAYGDRDLPFIPGLDAAGTVEALGKGVDSLRLGERVAAYTVGGSYADYVLADEKLCFSISDALDFEQAAGIGVLITAYNLLTQAGQLRKWETVLVHAGAGGVGSTLIQLAKALGAGKVFATVGRDDKKETVLALGADEAINYRNYAFYGVVNELTEGRGVNLILDSIAGKNAEASMTCLATFGRLVIYGHTGEGAAMISSKLLHKHNRAVIGYSSGGYRKERPEDLKEAAVKGLELLSSGDVKMLIGKRFSLSQAAQAHDWVESRQSVGKVLLIPDV